MVRSRFVYVLALAFGGFALAGCGAGNGGSGQSCPDGEPGCRCYGNGTCNPGLTCSSTGICGGSSSSGAPGNGNTPGAGGAPASGNGNTPGAGGAPASGSDTPPGAGGAPASGGGSGSGGATGNVVDTCNADLTCWEYGTYNVDPSVQLRRVGGDCLLGISLNQSETLDSDGTTNVGDTWYVDANDSLHLCDPNKPGYCWATCNVSSVLKFPCTGTATDCSMVPASQCSSFVNCNLDSSGNCGGGGTDCETFWKQGLCAQEGCTWSP